MKPFLACLLLLAPLTASLHSAEAPSREEHAVGPAQNETPTPASQLADKVREIAADHDMSEKTKAKLISGAVQAAVSSAIAGIKDPAEILRLTLELTGAAAKAAPRFGKAITQAVIGLPAIAGIEGALAQVEATVHQAAQEGNLAGKPGSARPSTHSDFGGSNSDVIVSPSF